MPSMPRDTELAVELPPEPLDSAAQADIDAIQAETTEAMQEWAEREAAQAAPEKYPPGDSSGYRSPLAH